MSARQDYLIRATGGGTHLAAACGAVYDAIAPRASFAYVNPVSDVADQMPADIETVRSWLERDGLDLVRTSSADDTAWAFTRAYTPWSVHVEVFDDASKRVATFDDCGHSIIANLTETEARAIASAVAPGHSVEPLLGTTTQAATERRTS
ncbi:MAG: hypothetical protein JO246_13340 [Frankiaceae bacterium]|nr:hypothetical protein [Frankiaceae bacterium]MBV9871311.1 hypothetical protein [Frankiaceae bacterium]